ncbi:MAG: hypothetical protein KOO69_03380 [Victivallales bacterium]|nr:hypothetical protein [Victivallales bacterium]
MKKSLIRVSLCTSVYICVLTTSGCRTNNIKREIVKFQKDGKTPVSREKYYDTSHGWNFFSAAKGKSFLNPSFSVVGK